METPFKAVSVESSWDQIMLLLLNNIALTNLEDHSTMQKLTPQGPSHCQRQLTEDAARSRKSRTKEDSIPSIHDWLYNTPPLLVLPLLPTLQSGKETLGGKIPEQNHYLRYKMLR